MARLKFLKDRMSAYGYYLPIDYAKIIGASRAYVSALINSGAIRTEQKFGREWVKTSVISPPPGGEPPHPLDAFLPYGFTKRMQSMVTGTVSCDIKQTTPNTVSIRFYTSSGDAICIEAYLPTVEVFT
jgi:hypothetical protein